MIEWTVRAALGARQVDRVVVSTEDEEIASKARDTGAEVIIRPAEMAGDTARFEPVLLHVLETLRVEEGYEPSLLVTMLCTSPLTLSEDVDGTIEMLLDKEADSALAATPCVPFLWRVNEDGFAEGINHDPTYRFMRQEIPPQYDELGAIYVMRTEGFLKYERQYFGRIVIYPIPPERSVDIDEPTDLVIAQALMALQEK